MNRLSLNPFPHFLCLPVTHDAVSSLHGLALDGEEEDDEVFAGIRRTRSKSSKDRRNRGLKSGTLMLCKKETDVLGSLRDVPTPDYDSGS